MALAVYLILLAAPTRVELVDQVFRIPGGEWRYLQIAIKQHPVSVGCEFETGSGQSEARAALVSESGLERLRQDRSYGVLASSRTGSSGGFRYRADAPGRYAVLLENRTRGTPASIHLRVFLEFAARGVTTLPAARRLAVVLISFAVFFGIVLYSANRLFRAMKKR